MKVRKKHFILIVSIISLTIIILALFLPREQGRFDYARVDGNARVLLPIDTSEKAAIFVKGFSDFEQQISAASQQVANSDIEVEWDIIVNRNESNNDNWDANIASRNVVPQFRCALTFSVDGEVVTNEGCKWIK